MKKATLLNFTD